MSLLAPGTVTDAAALAIPLDPVPAAQLAEGSPAAGFVELGSIGDIEVGVWEHTPGVSIDVESDEVFVVLSGSATVEFDDPALAAIELGAGSIVRLRAGMRTTWTVHETLRKVYFAG